MAVTGLTDKICSDDFGNAFCDNIYACLLFRQMKGFQKFASVDGSVHNHFTQDRHLNTRQNDKDLRSEALAEWKSLMARGQKRPALAPQDGDSFALV